MKQRDRDASRLEQDYMLRLKQVLSTRTLGEQMDILQQVRQEIEQRLGGAGEPVTLAEMAGVLQRIGSPEALALEKVALLATSRVAREAEAPQVLNYPTAEVVAPPDAKDAAALLKRIWLGTLIGVIGVFVPYINLELFAIAGSVMIAMAILRGKTRAHDQLRMVGELEWAVAGLLVAMSAVSIAGGMVPIIGLFNLLLLVALVACALIAYWVLMSTMARWVGQLGRDDVAAAIQLRRGMYVMVVFPLMLVVSVALGLMMEDELVAALVMLPIGWVAGYLFSLAPIRWTIEVLETPGGR